VSLCQRLLREHQFPATLSGERRTILELGTALADAATASWPSLERVSTYRPRIRSTQVTLQRRSVSEAELAKAMDIASRMMTEKLGTIPMAEAVCILETVSKKEVPLLGEVQVISFSDELAIVSLPGEIFVELGLALTKKTLHSNTPSSPKSRMAASATRRLARPSRRGTTRSSARAAHLTLERSSSTPRSSCCVK